MWARATECSFGKCSDDEIWVSDGSMPNHYARARIPVERKMSRWYHRTNFFEKLAWRHETGVHRSSVLLRLLTSRTAQSHSDSFRLGFPLGYPYTMLVFLHRWVFRRTFSTPGSSIESATIPARKHSCRQWIHSFRINMAHRPGFHLLRKVQSIMLIVRFANRLSLPVVEDKFRSVWFEMPEAIVERTALLASGIVYFQRRIVCSSFWVHRSRDRNIRSTDRLVWIVH